MRKVYLLFAIGLCVLVPGCGLFVNATRNLIVEPLQYHEGLERWRADKQRSKLADAAWKEVRQAHPDLAKSDDYARGFKQGFSDYLDVGGTSAPPPIPPRRYWKTSYLTTRHRSVEDWYAGFRHGVATAREGGHRQQWVMVPSSSAPLLPEPPVRVAPDPAPPNELLPTPKKLTPPLPESPGSPRVASSVLEKLVIPARAGVTTVRQDREVRNPFPTESPRPSLLHTWPWHWFGGRSSAPLP